MASVVPVSSIVLMTLSCCSVFALTTEKGIVKQLLENYAKVGQSGRPVGNATEPTTVTISFGLIELRDFDIEKQELIMVGWTALEWEDPMLTWNADDSGFSQISLEPSQIWIPDIVLANSISKPEPIHNTRVHVTSTGTVTWVDMYKYHFYCKVSIDDMDSDQFDCFLKFASWSMAADTLDLRNKGDRVDTNYYVANRDWELFKNKAKREEVEMPWGENMRSTQVKYEFTLKRRQKEEDEEEVSSASKVKVTSLLPVLIVGMLKAVFSS